MKNITTSALLAFLLLTVLSLSSCENKRDEKGNLLAQYLTSSSGSLSFKPMMRADSFSVQQFVPDTFLLDGKPYTGPVADYSKQQKLQFEGFIKDGLADSTWKFYYATGGLRMEGKYENGWDVGLWRAYYGYNKPKIDKLYDPYGYMLMRIDYYDNGNVMSYQNVKAPQFGDKERSYSSSRKGEILKIYVEDSVLLLQHGETTEHIGSNVFVRKP